METTTPKEPSLDSDNTLWTSGDIANYLRLSKSSVQSRILPRPSFPKPFQLAKTNTRRWEPTEVKEWVLLQRTK